MIKIRNRLISQISALHIKNPRKKLVRRLLRRKRGLDTLLITWGKTKNGM